jgi:hypothetical protein
METAGTGSPNETSQARPKAAPRSYDADYAVDVVHRTIEGRQWPYRFRTPVCRLSAPDVTAVSLSGDAPRWPAVLGVLAVGGYVGILSWSMYNTPYDVWGALIVGPALLLVTWPLLSIAGRQEPDPWVRRLFAWALVLKLGASVARWAMAFVLYDGFADAKKFSAEGAALAPLFRDGVFTVDLERGIIGSGFIYIVTGLVYALTGPTLIGGYLVFSWFGFWGLYCLYRAFRIAMPDADHRRYAVLIFLLPSMLFWPSGLGKEAWMTLGIGVTALGAAKLLTRDKSGWVLLALGLTGTAMVRPHITALTFVALFVGYLLRASPRRSPLTPIARTGGIMVLLLVGALIATRAADFFDIDSLTPSSVETVLNDTERRTDGGGSSFEAKRVDGPKDFPVALISVLFRPFPWEAHNAQALLAAGEGMLLLGLAALSHARLRRIWDYRPGRPYVAVSLTFVVLFVFAFSTFGNFGIIARERIMVYPFLLALLSLPKRPTPRRGSVRSSGRLREFGESGHTRRP